MRESKVSKHEEMVGVYRAAGEAEAQIIKGLLKNHGIPCLLKSNVAPSVHVLTVNGMGEFKVMVWKSMEKQARELIEGKGYVQMAG